MKIATVLHAHGDENVTLDAIDAIQTWVGNDILVSVDGASQDWGNRLQLPVYKMMAFPHHANKAAFRNLTLGLMKLVEQWPDADWYCTTEYDVLFASDAFKEILSIADERDVWCLGNSHRCDINLKMPPLLETIVQSKIKENRYLLGCCVFHSGKFLRILRDVDFFDRFLFYTNDFKKGFFPEFTGYDIGEHLYPTLAVHFGGQVAQFAKWSLELVAWTGDFKRFPMRWKPEIDPITENFPEAVIFHPIKSYDHPIRQQQRYKRRHKKDNYVRQSNS